MGVENSSTNVGYVDILSIYKEFNKNPVTAGVQGTRGKDPTADTGGRGSSQNKIGNK